MAFESMGRRECLAWQQTIREARVYIIECTDNDKFYFTDHDTKIEYPPSAEYPSGVTYTPLNGINATSHRKESGLKSHGADIIGVLSDDTITEEDLRTGKFRNAKITMWLVDWMYPWNMYFEEHIFWIVNIEWNGQIWQAEISGLGKWLSNKVGGTIEEECQNEFCDERCTLTKSTYLGSTQTVATVASEYPRKYFFGDNIHIPYPNDSDLIGGELVWQTGDNAGITSRILDYDSFDLHIVLALDTPYDIQIDDTFKCVKACPKTVEGCQGFSNINNHNGDPFLPGMDNVLSTPDSMV